ncbi:MAG: aminotransferase class III-fold pyridoxal phosphate-dependent enzyme [Bacteroidota bacterium]
MTNKEIFENNLAQTKHSIFKLDIEKAEGVYVWDKAGKKYFDFLSGISVSNLGHRNPAIIKAINDQLAKYMHVMVYGEFIQSPQIQLAKLLADILPDKLQTSFFVNSGSEAIDGAIKLAKKYTKKNEIAVFKNAYHGSTLGAISLLSDEKYKKDFLPLIPDIRFLEFNNLNDLQIISDKTACVIIEPIQAASGIIMPENNFLKHLRNRCDQTNSLLIFDEIQTGLGRTGKMFAFEHFNVIPDILVLAKGLGGGLPLGAFISSKNIMSVFNQEHPLEGHATTHGGNPVSCAAAIETISIISNTKTLLNVHENFKILSEILQNSGKVKKIRGIGLFLAIELESFEHVKKTVLNGLKNGVLLNWFLFNNRSIFIAPPLTINNSETETAANLIIRSISL